MPLRNGKPTKITTSGGVAMDVSDAREKGVSDESGASADGPTGSARRVRFMDDAEGACGTSDVHEVQELVYESSGSDTLGAAGGLYERVLEGLKETRMSMRELRAGMNEAREGMNEAYDGMKELKEMVIRQTENVSRLLEAMTRINTGSNCQGGLIKEHSISSDDTVVLDHNCSRTNVNSEFANGRPSGPASLLSMGSSQVKVKVDRDAIPYFEARPSSDALARSQELETWLRRLELVTPDDADNTRIRLARTYCKGTADLIINSPAFEVISSWSHFKSLLRQKFRGTANSSDFFNNLQRKTLKHGQTPQDFLLEIEGFVYLGVREYSIEIGDPVALIRRVFLGGLPSDLSDLLVACEDLPLHEIVAKANKLFMSRAARTPSRETRRPIPVASTQLHEASVPYCYYHRASGHSTVDCQEKPPGRVCWQCRRHDHRRFECPFLPGRGVEASRLPGRTDEEARPVDQPPPQSRESW